MAPHSSQFSALSDGIIVTRTGMSQSISHQPTSSIVINTSVYKVIGQVQKTCQYIKISIVRLCLWHLCLRARARVCVHVWCLCICVCVCGVYVCVRTCGLDGVQTLMAALKFVLITTRSANVFWVKIRHVKMVEYTHTHTHTHMITDPYTYISYAYRVDHVN